MNRQGYINSSPRFFRLIGWAALLGTGTLVLLAAFVPAPLQEPANPALVPNPVKAGWFLLWIQEVVSWSKQWIYLVLAAGVWLVALPWLAGQPATEQASWWPRQRHWLNALFVLIVLSVLALSVLAIWFRGENWALVLPWG
jgi:hypothetical protein